MANMTLIATPLGSRKKLWIGGLVAVAVIFAVLQIAGALLTNLARRSIMQSVQQLVPGTVTLGKVSVSLFPGVHISGEKLEVRRGEGALPAFLSVPHYSIDGGLFGVLQRPRHFGTLHLENLRMEVPPKGERVHVEFTKSSSPGSRIDTIVAENAVLELLPKAPGQQAHDFEIYRIVLHAPQPDRAIRYSATVRIPMPPSDIEVSGEIGPIHRGEIASTPVSGSYQMRNSDLARVKGILGTLSSDGKFKGDLDRIEVEGTVDSPNFATKRAGHRMHVTSQFKAQVNGTNGDTKLESVRARFLNSLVTASGEIAGSPGVKGKKISLDIDVENARVADLLALVIRSPKSPVTGVASLRGKFVLPPRRGEILERMLCNGSLGIGGGKITKPAAQAKINELSAKAEAEPEEGSRENVVSSLRGPFTMSGGVAHFSLLAFSVPGASAEMHGTWTPRSEAMNFSGILRMDAKLSQTQTGIKAFFLKAVDPFFKNKRTNSGAAIPVKVGGTLQHPEVSVNAFSR